MKAAGVKLQDSTEGTTVDAKEMENPSFRITEPWLDEFILKHFTLGTRRLKYKMRHLRALLFEVQREIQAQPILVELEKPVFICGDIHGQLTDLRRIFYACGFPNRHKYLFLGDYVDRGDYSLEVICLLLAFRLKYPKNIFLLRGNHELAHINKSYGFLEDIQKRWTNRAESKMIYDQFNRLFSHLPLSAVVSKKILCMHGGLSPRLTSLEDIKKIQRPITVPRELAQDILWADPEAGVCGFKTNVLRACSFNFGETDVTDKCKQLGISMLIRAHQVVERGYQLFAKGRVITVFSASRYQDDMWNYAGIIYVDSAFKISVYQMKPQEFEEIKKRAEEELTENQNEEGEDEGEGGRKSEKSQ